MGTKFEIYFLRFLFGFSIVSFFNLLRKPPLKDWLLIFLLKSNIASFLDALIVNKGYIEYPVKLVKSFNISVIYSYLLYPVTCVYFNQVTRNSNIMAILLKSLYFTTPMVIGEVLIEKYTNLIKFKKTWNWRYSFASILGTFLFVRFTIMLINKIGRASSRKYRW